MYLTTPFNHAIALDARTGKQVWRYEHKQSGTPIICCGPNNRRLAAAYGRVYMATLDAHLVALDQKTGKVVWDVQVDDPTAGYSLTIAPLAYKGMIIVGTRVADDDHPLVGEGSDRQAVAGGGVIDLDIPDHLAGLLVESDQVSIEGRHVHAAVRGSEAAVVGAAADDRVGPLLVLIAPERLAGPRVERHGVVERRGEVHDAVDHQRRGLEGADRAAGLIHPARDERSDVLGVDLLRGRVAGVAVILAVREPVLGVGGSVGEHLVGHFGVGDRGTLGLGRHHAGGDKQRDGNPGHGSHGVPPR